MPSTAACADEAAVALGEHVDLRHDERFHRGRELFEREAGARRGDELLQQQRVSAGALHQRGHRTRREHGHRRRPGEQRRRRAGVQRSERQGRRGLEDARRPRRGAWTATRCPAPGRPCAARWASEPGRGLVEPVGVLDDEQQPARCPSSRLDEAARAGRAAAPARTRAPGRASRGVASSSRLKPDADQRQPVGERRHQARHDARAAPPRRLVVGRVGGHADQLPQRRVQRAVRASARRRGRPRP